MQKILWIGLSHCQVNKIKQRIVNCRMYVILWELPEQELSTWNTLEKCQNQLCFFCFVKMCESHIECTTFIHHHTMTPGTNRYNVYNPQGWTDEQTSFLALSVTPWIAAGVAFLFEPQLLWDASAKASWFVASSVQGHSFENFLWHLWDFEVLQSQGTACYSIHSLLTNSSSVRSFIPGQ